MIDDEHAADPSREQLFGLRGVSVFQTDSKTGRITRASGAFCQLLGYTEAELQGLTYGSLRRNPAAIPDSEAGSPQRFWAKDGSVRWLELYPTIFPAEAGSDNEGGYTLTVAYDLTERKQLEVGAADFDVALEQQVETRTAELKRSETRFLSAFSAGPVAACIATTEPETLLEVNDAFTQLTGYTQDEALGKTTAELELWSAVTDQAKLLEAEAAEQVRDLELSLRTKRGDRKDILLSSETVRLDGQTVHLRMFFDVTERKEAETWRELLRQALENAEEAVIITDAELSPPGPTIIYVNAAFTTMTGYAAAEVLGRSPRIFQGPQSDRAVLWRMRRRLMTGSTFDGEIINYRKNGDSFVLAWSVAPLLDAQGRVTHYVSTQHDVTERRGLERELLDLSARQQRRVADELHDTVQQQLVGTALHAKHLVERTESLRPQLGAELAAEFAAGLAELYDLIRDSIQGVRTVLGGVAPAHALENGFLVALTSMCERITNLFRVPCTFAFEQPLLVRDSARATNLFYIVQEACVNAARHAHASRVEVRLAGRGEHYTLTVTDDGVGITKDTLSRGGPGLELMAYRAKLLGAELGLDSSPGLGTTVSLSFST